MLQPLILLMLCIGSAKGTTLFNPLAALFPNPYQVPAENLTFLIYGNVTGIYDSQNEKCCLGKVSPATPFAKCCGSETYNPTKQLCCQSEVKELKTGYACCGKDVYNTDTDFCCADGHTVKKTVAVDGYTACCGETTYDSSKEDCCQDVIIKNKTIYTVCCGKNLMDYRTQICCWGDNKERTVNGKKYDESSCCNNQVINDEVEDCCNNTIIKTSEEICCYDANARSSKVVPVSKPNQQCCGLATYDPETQTCCGDQVYSNQNSTKQGCCNDKDVYDFETEVCCSPPAATYPEGGKVIKMKQPGQTGCCGDETYNYMNESCCGDKVYHTVRGMCCIDPDTGEEGFIEVEIQWGYGCCGSKPYNSLTQLCCGKLVVDKSDYTACCGDKSYDASKQTCCSKYDSNGKVTNEVITTEPGKYCCGSEMISADSRLGCCGGKSYNYTLQTCCGLQLFSKGDNDGRNTCCYERTTDYSPLGMPWPLGK